MKKLIILLALGMLMAGCANESNRPTTRDQYPASNPVGAPGKTVPEALSGGETNSYYP